MFPLSLAGSVTQASSFPSLSLSVFTHKMGLIILPLGCAEMEKGDACGVPSPVSLASCSRSINASLISLLFPYHPLLFLSLAF